MGDTMNILKYLIENDITICTAESLTGGYISNAITDYAGISKIFRGSIVAYSKQSKTEILKVAYSTIEKYGMVSKQCASEMAMNAAKIFKTEIAIATTGVAGPDLMENQAVGTVYIALYYKAQLYVKKLNLQGNRNVIKKQVTENVFKLIAETLNYVKQ